MTTRMLTVTSPTNPEPQFHIYTGGTDSEALHQFLTLNDPGDEYTVTFENYEGDEPFDERDYSEIDF